MQGDSIVNFENPDIRNFATEDSQSHCTFYIRNVLQLHGFNDVFGVVSQKKGNVDKPIIIFKILKGVSNS